MPRGKFGLRRLEEWCSNSEECKDFFSEKKRNNLFSGFVVESTRIDELQCSKLDIKKNVPLVRTVKYWGKNTCGNCSSNLDVVNFFLERKG